MTLLNEKPSITAFIAALMRATATKENDPNIRGSDDMAYLFLDDEGRAMLNDPKKLQKNREENFKPGVYESVIARTKLIDHLFKKALQEKVPQIVFLGAGFDSRSWRFQPLIQETQIFEIDLPVTQKTKQWFLSQNEISTPKDLHFISTTFDLDSLETDLIESGFDPDKKTFFILEGVIYFLTEEAVDKTLQFIHSNSPSGSTLYEGANEVMETLKELGEPWKSGIREGQIKEFLSSRNLKLIKSYTRHEIENEFLVKSDGELFGHSSDYLCMAHGMVE